MKSWENFEKGEGMGDKTMINLFFSLSFYYSSVCIGQWLTFSQSQIKSHQFNSMLFPTQYNKRVAPKERFLDKMNNCHKFIWIACSFSQAVYNDCKSSRQISNHCFHRDKMKLKMRRKCQKHMILNVSVRVNLSIFLFNSSFVSMCALMSINSLFCPHFWDNSPKMH